MRILFIESINIVFDVILKLIPEKMLLFIVIFELQIFNNPMFEFITLKLLIKKSEFSPYIKETNEKVSLLFVINSKLVI